MKSYKNLLATLSTLQKRNIFIYLLAGKKKTRWFLHLFGYIRKPFTSEIQKVKITTDQSLNPASKTRTSIKTKSQVKIFVIYFSNFFVSSVNIFINQDEEQVTESISIQKFFL